MTLHAEVQKNPANLCVFMNVKDGPQMWVFTISHNALLLIYDSLTRIWRKATHAQVLIHVEVLLFIPWLAHR